MEKKNPFNVLVRFRYKDHVYTMPKINLERKDMRGFVKKIKVLKIIKPIKIPKTTPKMQRTPRVNVKKLPGIRVRKKRIIIVRKRRKRIRRRIPIHKQKPRKMTGIEIRQLKGVADSYGVPRDLIDWEAHIDPSLTYSENKRIITRVVKRSGGYRDYEIGKGQVRAEQAGYLEKLAFKASAGDTKAYKEFKFLKRAWRL